MLKRIDLFRVTVLGLLVVMTVFVVLLWFQSAGIASSARNIANTVDHTELRMFCADKSPGTQVRTGVNGAAPLTCNTVLTAP